MNGFLKSRDQNKKIFPVISHTNDTYRPKTNLLEENYPLLLEQEMSVREKILNCRMQPYTLSLAKDLKSGGNNK